MKILFLLLLLTASSFAQADLSKFDFVGKTDVSAYLVEKDHIKRGDIVNFTVLLAKIESIEGDTVALDPDNYFLITIIGGCQKKTYKILVDTGRLAGEAKTRNVLGKTLTATPGSAIDSVLNFVCKDIKLSAMK